MALLSLNCFITLLARDSLLRGGPFAMLIWCRVSPTLAASRWNFSVFRWATGLNFIMGDIDFKDTLAFNRCQSFYSLSVWCLDQTSARSLGATTDDVLSHSGTLNTFVFHLSLAQLHWLVFSCTSVFSRSPSTNCQWPFACTAMNITDVALYSGNSVCGVPARVFDGRVSLRQTKVTIRG